MPIAYIGSEDFSKGLVTAVPAHLIEDGATPNCQNIDFSESFGRLTKRKGQSTLFTANAGSIQVTGLYEYIQADGDTFVIASSNDDVYNLTGSGTWTSIHNNASLNGANVNFTTFNDLLIIVSENLTTQKWNGAGSSSDLLGTPPSNVKYIENHKGRVWMANSSAGKSRLHFSSIDNAEDWTTSGDSGASYIDVGINDGDQITAIASIGSVLIVWKNTSTWAVYGNKPSNFTVRKISNAVGCVAPKSVVIAESFAIFLGQDGVYSARPDGVALLSYNIKPTIDTISYATKQIASAGRLRSQYWLAIDTDADSKNDTVYVLDYVYGSWGIYTNIKASVFCRRRAGTLISGGSDTDIIRLHDDTENDTGSAINAIWDTKEYHLDTWTNLKQIHDIMMSAAPITGKAITISHIINGITQGTTLTFTLTPTSTEDKVFLSKQHVPDTSYGQYIKFRFSNNETDARIKIYGYSIAANVLERQNG